MEILLHEKSYARVRERLRGLDLGLNVVRVDADGSYARDGERIGPEDAKPEVFWLGLEFIDAGQFDDAFDMALRPGTVKWMQTMNAGLDRGRYREIVEAGIRLSNSGATAVAIAEYVMAQVLNAYQPFEDQLAAQARGEWRATRFRELSRSVWLIVGFGPIGRAVAARARAFGARIMVVRRGSESRGLADEMGRLEDLPDLLPRADVIVLACSLNDGTRGLADADFFRRVKEDAVLVNVARGALVDDAALIDCLDSGRLRRAVLDVFAKEPLDPGSPYWSHPRARVTAHTSWAGDGAVPRGDDLFLDNLARYVRGEPLEMEVDPADVPRPAPRRS